MVKARVGQHLKEVLLGSAAHASKSSNLSADLEFLSGQFKRLKLRIKKLIDALKAQHVSLLTMNESRFLVRSAYWYACHDFINCVLVGYWMIMITTDSLICI